MRKMSGLAKSRLFVQNATQAVKTSFCRFLPLNLRLLPKLLEIGLKGVLGPILLFKHQIIELYDVLYPLNSQEILFLNKLKNCYILSPGII